MKALIAAIIILMWNVSLSGVVGSGIFDTAGLHYESSYYDIYNTSLPSNISTIHETEQYSSSMNIVGLMFSTLSWNWIFQFVPLAYHTSVAWFVIGLNIISAALIAVAFVELFMKRSIM